VCRQSTPAHSSSVPLKASGELEFIGLSRIPRGPVPATLDRRIRVNHSPRLPNTRRPRPFSGQSIADFAASARLIFLERSRHTPGTTHGRAHTSPSIVELPATNVRIAAHYSSRNVVAHDAFLTQPRFGVVVRVPRFARGPRARSSRREPLERSLRCRDQYVENSGDIDLGDRSGCGRLENLLPWFGSNRADSFPEIADSRPPRTLPQTYRPGDSPPKSYPTEQVSRLKATRAAMRSRCGTERGSIVRSRESAVVSASIAGPCADVWTSASVNLADLSTARHTTPQNFATRRCNGARLVSFTASNSLQLFPIVRSLPIRHTLRLRFVK